MVRGRDLQRMDGSQRDEAYRRVSRGMLGLTSMPVPGELARMHEVLGPDEDLITYTTGQLGDNTWLVALTDRRILMLDNRLFTGMEQHFIELRHVNAITTNRGIVFGEIAIQDGATTRTITNVPKKAVNRFVNSARDAIAALTSAPTDAASATPTPTTRRHAFGFAAHGTAVETTPTGRELTTMTDRERADVFAEISRGLVGSAARVERHLDRLPQVLEGEECLIVYINGSLDLKECLLALTDRRLVVLQETEGDSLSDRDLSLGDIVDMSFKRGPFFSRLTIDCGDREEQFYQMPKDGLERFIERARVAISDYTQSAAVGRLTPSGASDSALSDLNDRATMLDELERLAELWRDGVLTDREFAAAKAKLLE